MPASSLSRFLVQAICFLLLLIAPWYYVAGLLATPVILAAGVLKLPDLLGPAGDGIRPQVLVGSLLSGVGAYLSVRFLTGYFEHRSMRPFGIYCIAAGAACLAWFLV